MDTDNYREQRSKETVRYDNSDKDEDRSRVWVCYVVKQKLQRCNYDFEMED